MHRSSIRTKLVYYIFLTIIITFIVFGAWMLGTERKRWDSYQLEQTLAFSSFTSPEIIKLFGRTVKSEEVKSPFDINVKELLRYNKDLVSFMILNVNGATIYDSDLYVNFLSKNDEQDIEELKDELSSDIIRSELQNYRIVTLKSGKKIIDVITPVIHLTGSHILSVRFLISYHSIDNKVEGIKRDLYITIFVALCFSFLLLVFISKRITNPVYILTRIVKRMREGDFNARVKTPTNDEIGELSVAFNEMATTLKSDREAIENKNEELIAANIELKGLQQQLIKSERLAAVGQLAAGVSHEIDNPIGIILGYAEFIKSELDSESPILDELESIINESKRCRRIVGGLLNFSKTSPSINEELDLNDIAKEVVSAVSFQSLFKQITIKEEYDHDIPVLMLDRDKIKQVLINLLINSAQATGNEGEVIVSTKYLKKDDEEFVKLYVKDFGVGIPEENLGNIFDPFYSTKTLSKGTGLGLSICQKLVEELNGRISVKSDVKKGSVFALTFPVLHQ
jgi:signal transduction histidine kinase